jgi:hypothetical protein
VARGLVTEGGASLVYGLALARRGDQPARRRLARDPPGRCRADHVDARAHPGLGPNPSNAVGLPVLEPLPLTRKPAIGPAFVIAARGADTRASTVPELNRAPILLGPRTHRSRGTYGPGGGLVRRARRAPWETLPARSGRTAGPAGQAPSPVRRRQRWMQRSRSCGRTARPHRSTASVAWPS